MEKFPHLNKLKSLKVSKFKDEGNDEGGEVGDEDCVEGVEGDDEGS